MAETNVYQAPDAELGKRMYCRHCGAGMPEDEAFCAKCGGHQPDFGRSRGTAAVLAFFVGIWGLHRFYLGQWWGVFYLLFFWTYIPMLVGWVEAIVFVATSKESWAKKYGHLPRKPNMWLFGIGIVLIFVVFIGILAAVAIPAYQDYLARAAGQ